MQPKTTVSMVIIGAQSSGKTRVFTELSGEAKSNEATQLTQAHRVMIRRGSPVLVTVSQFETNFEFTQEYRALFAGADILILCINDDAPDSVKKVPHFIPLIRMVSPRTRLQILNTGSGQHAAEVVTETLGMLSEFTFGFLAEVGDQTLE